MYKRYITRNGTKMGPYFYHSVKTEDGRVLSVYLGSNEEAATNKLEQLKMDIDTVKKRRESGVQELRERLGEKQEVPTEPAPEMAQETEESITL